MSEQHNEICAQEAELLLLRRVYEASRRLMRFNGVDKARAEQAYSEMDSACEQVKLFDGNCMEEEDLLATLEASGPLIALVLRLLVAYEAGYGHGLALDCQDNARGELYTDPRENMAHQLGYRKGAALSNRQGSLTPHVIRGEGDRSTFGKLVLQEALKKTTGASNALA